MAMLQSLKVRFFGLRFGFNKFGAIALVMLVGVFGLFSTVDEARADGFFIGGGGVSVVIGTGGYYYGGPVYRPIVRPYPRYYYPHVRPAYPYRSRAYVHPPRYYRTQPQRVPYTKTGLVPFTPQWVAYCARKYKSFNPNTGTYLAYSGRYRFCR